MLRRWVCAGFVVLATVLAGCKDEKPKLAPLTDEDKAIIQKIKNRPTKATRGADANR